MRGTPQRGDPNIAGLGIIPAYAGNTTVYNYQMEYLRDHPRVCGEHYDFRCRVDGEQGIIPAYAGNTEAFAVRHQ